MWIILLYKKLKRDVSNLYVELSMFELKKASMPLLFSMCIDEKQHVSIFLHHLIEMSYLVFGIEIHKVLIFHAIFHEIDATLFSNEFNAFSGTTSPIPLCLSCLRLLPYRCNRTKADVTFPRNHFKEYIIEINLHCIFTNSCDITDGSVRKSDCVPTSTIGVRDFRKIGVHFSRTATNVSGLITEKHNKNTSLSG